MGAVDAALAGFLGSLENAAAFPAAGRLAGIQQTLGILACLFAGAPIPEMAPVLRAYTRSDETTFIPAANVHSEPALAAGAMAALAHAAELDPIHAATIICPAAVPIPAALALA